MEKLLDLFERIKQDEILLQYFEHHPINIVNIEFSISMVSKKGKDLPNSLMDSICYEKSFSRNPEAKDIAYFFASPPVGSGDIHKETLQEAIDAAIASTGNEKFRRLLIPEQMPDNLEEKRICK